MTRRWVVAGRVQGVGFRNFVRHHALKLGLVGFAANLPDGRVEVVAMGEETSLGHLERLLRTGPSLARVRSVEQEPVAEGAGPFSGFVAR
ncbi:MAG TPA: acylphosphatase [Gemmatimonadales bacterium]|nr:acylphosphatase [Gemmatimonadales bacterium]